MADTRLYVTEITIKALVAANSQEKACEDALKNTFLEVPLATVLNHDVQMKARAVETGEDLVEAGAPIFDPSTDPLNQSGDPFFRFRFSGSSRDAFRELGAELRAAGNRLIEQDGEIANILRLAADDFEEAVGSDRDDLHAVADEIARGNFKKALQMADDLDTLVRDEIPQQVWEYLHDRA